MAEYAIAPDAERDLSDIAAYTIAHWGAQQCSRYEAELVACFNALASGDVRVRRPIPQRPEIHVCRCEHHYVFALRRDGEPILVLAVLHESMDLIARLRSRLG